MEPPHLVGTCEGHPEHPVSLSVGPFVFSKASVTRHLMRRHTSTLWTNSSRSSMSSNSRRPRSWASKLAEPMCDPIVRAGVMLASHSVHTGIHSFLQVAWRRIVAFNGRLGVGSNLEQVRTASRPFVFCSAKCAPKCQETKI